MQKIPFLTVADFLSKLEWVKNEKTGCWDLIRPRSGVLRLGSKIYTVHRIAYTVYVNDMIDGFFVFRKCFNSKCFNPEHLEIMPDRVHIATLRERHASF